MHNKIEVDSLSWFEIAQIRRSPPKASNEGWNQLGTPMPLARAVRDALEMMSREPVSIMMVRPRAGMGRLGDREIMRLSRREDYPYRLSEEESVRS